MAVVWFMKKYRCRNGIEERTKFPVRTEGDAKSRRAQRSARKAVRKSTSTSQALARSLNNNFDPGRDKHVILEYSPAGLEKAMRRANGLDDGETPFDDRLLMAGQTEFSNCVRRVQRALPEGMEFRYVGCTSDMDGDTGEGVRLHHHVVINAEAEALVREKWSKMGFVMDGELYTVRGDFSALAEYMVKQVRHIENMKAYVPSRNLVPCVETEPVPVPLYGESEIRLPKGCVAIYRAPYIRGRSQYLRYYRPGDERGVGDAAPYGRRFGGEGA